MANESNFCTLYTVSGKKGATLFFAILCQILTDLQNSFTVTLSSKFKIEIIKYPTIIHPRRHPTL